MVLTTQPLSHCGAAKPHGRGGVCRHLEKHANRNLNFCLTSSKRTSHSSLSESQAHTRPLPLPTPPHLHSDSLSLCLSLLSPPSPFSPVSRISGESNYISVGLAAWRWSAAWLWANTWPRLEEQRGWGVADVLQVLWASLWPSSVEHCRYNVERWITNVGMGTVRA